MNIADVRAGLADKLDNISGLRVWSYMPDQPSPPCAVVTPERIGYGDFTFDALQTSTWIVLVLAAAVSDRNGQTKLDTYLADTGSVSIRAAVEADPTLSSKCNNARVVEVREYGTVTLANGLRYYSAELVVEVVA